MPTDTKPRAPGYAGRTATKAPHWGALVAWDMLFNNLSSGLFLVAAISELVAPDIFTPVARVAYPVALVLLLADLVCLVFDLGDPLRFHHMLRVFKPSSPMSLGTWCLTIYSLPLTVAAVLALLPWAALEWVRVLAVVLGLLPAFGAAVYKGVLLSTTAQPGWKDARWMGGYLTSSAFVLGCAEMLALSALLGQTSATAILRPALAVLLALSGVFLGLLIADLRPALSRVYTRQQSLLGALSLGVAALVALGLLLGGDSLFAELGAVALVVAGNLIIRFAIVKLPHSSAASGLALGATSER